MLQLYKIISHFLKYNSNSNYGKIGRGGGMGGVGYFCFPQGFEGYGMEIAGGTCEAHGKMSGNVRLFVSIAFLSHISHFIRSQCPHSCPVCVRIKRKPTASAGAYLFQTIEVFSLTTR